MLFSDFLQIIDVFIEVAVTVIARVIAIRHQKSFGWCFAVTFGLFVLFDTGRIFALPIPDAAHALIVLVACSSMLYGVWQLYRGGFCSGVGHYSLQHLTPIPGEIPVTS